MSRRCTWHARRRRWTVDTSSWTARRRPTIRTWWMWLPKMESTMTGYYRFRNSGGSSLRSRSAGSEWRSWWALAMPFASIYWANGMSCLEDSVCGEPSVGGCFRSLPAYWSTRFPDRTTRKIILWSTSWWEPRYCRTCWYPVVLRWVGEKATNSIESSAFRCHFQFKPNGMSSSIIKDVAKLFKSLRIAVFFVWCIAIGFCMALVWNFLFWHLEDLADQKSEWVHVLLMNRLSH